MISIQEAAVANALIDHKWIDTTLLMPARPRDQEIQKDWHLAFLMNGDQLYFKPSIRYYSCASRQGRYLMKSNELVIKYVSNFCVWSNSEKFSTGDFYF
jgi:hypothetical protein